MSQCTWLSEDNLEESVLSLHHVGPRDYTQIIRLGGKCLYLQRALSLALDFKIYRVYRKVYMCWVGRHKTSKNK